MLLESIVIRPVEVAVASFSLSGGFGPIIIPLFQGSLLTLKSNEFVMSKLLVL